MPDLAATLCHARQPIKRGIAPPPLHAALRLLLPAFSDWLRIAMHLRLTEPELAALIEMVSLAADVAAWNQKPGAQEKLTAYEQIEAKLLDKAAHSGLGACIEFDAERQRLRMKQGVEPPFFYQECYDEFRNESFWEELAIRLSDRDLARSIGHSAWSALSEEERRARTPNLEKRYWEEFTKFGVERVVVLAPPEEG